MARRHEVRAVDVRVEGDVQGVGYRFSALREASSLGVSGWVRNEPDGAVTAHVEGTGDRVDRMLAWMRSGPQWSHVTRLDVEAAPVEGLDGFTIR